MTDFEMQRRLRELNAPRAPRNDLWIAIAPRLAGPLPAPAMRSRQHWLALAAAASVLLAVLAGSWMVGVHEQDAGQSVTTTATQVVTPQQAIESARARGDDPRLAGAVIVLDAAHAELEQALERHPDAVFLVSLLNRTDMRRMKLGHYGANAG